MIGMLGTDHLTFEGGGEGMGDLVFGLDFFS